MTGGGINSIATANTKREAWASLMIDTTHVLDTYLPAPPPPPELKLMPLFNNVIITATNRTINSTVYI